MQFILLTWSPKQDCLHEGLCWQMSLNGCQRMHVFATTAATSLPVSMFRRHEQMSDTTNWRQNSNWIQLTIASLYIVHLRLSWKIAKEFEISRPIFESIKSDAFRLHAKTHHALAGRFGNELFVVAAALVHAHRNHHPVLLIRPGKIPTRIDNVEVHLRYISQDLFGAKVMWEMDMDAWKACFFFFCKNTSTGPRKNARFFVFHAFEAALAYGEKPRWWRVMEFQGSRISSNIGVIAKWRMDWHLRQCFRCMNDDLCIIALLMSL